MEDSYSAAGVLLLWINGGKTRLGKPPNAYDEIRTKPSDHPGKGAVAGRKEGRPLGGGKFVRGDVSARLAQEGQGTVVGNDVSGKECLGEAKAISEQPPESSAAYLAAGALEPQNRALGMTAFRLGYCRRNPHPFAHEDRIAERDTGLHHTKGAWIHAKEQRPRSFAGVAADVVLEWAPGVVQGVVNHRDGGGEGKRLHLVSQV